MVSVRLLAAMGCQVAGVVLIATAATLAFGLVGLLAVLGAALYLLAEDLVVDAGSEGGR